MLFLVILLPFCFSWLHLCYQVNRMFFKMKSIWPDQAKFVTSVTTEHKKGHTLCNVRFLFLKNMIYLVFWQSTQLSSWIVSKLQFNGNFVKHSRRWGCFVIVNNGRKVNLSSVPFQATCPRLYIYFLFFQGSLCRSQICNTHKDSHNHGIKAMCRL